MTNNDLPSQIRDLTGVMGKKMGDCEEVLGAPPSEEADPLKTRPKAALFVSRYCPIYREAHKAYGKGGTIKKGGGVKDAFLNAMLGNSPQARANWRHGARIQAQTIEEIMVRMDAVWPNKTTAGESIAILPDGSTLPLLKILLSIRNDYVTFEDFAAMVGLEKEAASKILDDDYFSDAPLLTDMYYKRRTKAEERKKRSEIDDDFNLLKGFYFGRIRRTTVNGLNIDLEIKLHVKYIFDYHQKHLIRTKLKIPYYVDNEGNPIAPDDQSPRHAAIYDGCVRMIRTTVTDAAGDHVVWTFQKRRDRGKVDFEFFITEPPKAASDRYYPDGAPTILKGRFLTLDQEGRVDGDEIILRKMSDRDELDGFMDEVEWKLV